jgi:hypothetical protein
MRLGSSILHTISTFDQPMNELLSSSQTTINPGITGMMTDPSLDFQ